MPFPSSTIINESFSVHPEQVDTYLKSLAAMTEKILVDQKASSKISLADGISDLMQSAQKSHQQGGKVIFIGNGGSAAIASHMANDFSKNGGIRAVCFSDSAQLTCLSNDYGYDQVYAKAIEMLAQPQDILVAISSSGKSANILNAVQSAKARECKIFTFSGFDADNPLRKSGSVNFYVPSHEYGFVELTHMIICHATIDFICEKISKNYSSAALPIKS